jgi:hypothetical protein
MFSLVLAFLDLPGGRAYGQTQMPGQIAKFDEPGARRGCDSRTRTKEEEPRDRERCDLRVVDSVITETSNGNIPIGTVTPFANSIYSAAILNREHSSAATGNILKSGALFIHDFGIDNTFIGSDAGNLSMFGTSNTTAGFNVLHHN